jgi:hypothetical protein
MGAFSEMMDTRRRAEVRRLARPRALARAMAEPLEELAVSYADRADEAMQAGSPAQARYLLGWAEKAARAGAEL